MTGVSGAGKSSLAFDTLYAEGQRRYVETFSAYARQFLEPLEKPDAERIESIPPAIAVGRARWPPSGRSTVGTIAEIHEYLGCSSPGPARSSAARCGHTSSPATPAIVAQAIEALPAGTRYEIAFPLEIRPGPTRRRSPGRCSKTGFTRLRIDGQPPALDEPDLALAGRAAPST